MPKKKKSGAYDKKNDYNRRNYKRFSLTFKKDDPVAEKLEATDNMSAYVRELIMADIEAHRPVKSTICVTPDLAELVPTICSVFDTDIDIVRWTDREIDGTMRFMCDSIPEISKDTAFDDTAYSTKTMEDFLKVRKVTGSGIIGIYAQPCGEGACRALGVFNGGFLMIEAFHGMEEGSDSMQVFTNVTHMLDFSDLIGNPQATARKLNECLKVQLFE